MKIPKLALGLAICFSLCGCITCRKTDEAGRPGPGKLATASDSWAGTNFKLLRITAHVDGSGRMIFTRGSVRYEHSSWSPPVDVTFDGEPWANLDRTPSTWRDPGARLDLTRAMIVSRKGRDVIALEPTAGGFDLYLCDSPNGSADYEVIIAIPLRD